ncbi:MAG: transposase [Cryomorphaceae bacterium]|nr:MAG: transposase [Cryomorphaceae bacterium]
MSRSHKFHNPKGVYFVSFAVIDWIDVFSRRDYRDIVLDSLRFCQNEKGMEIFSWCIMTNHVHLVFRTTENQKPDNVLGDMKRFTSGKIVEAIKVHPQESRKEWMLEHFKEAAEKSSNVKHYQFWRHDNKPIELWSNAVIDEKVNYIHQNPVEAGFVAEPHHYLYSSALDYAGEQGLLENVILVG